MSPGRGTTAVGGRGLDRPDRGGPHRRSFAVLLTVVGKPSAGKSYGTPVGDMEALCIAASILIAGLAPSR